MLAHVDQNIDHHTIVNQWRNWRGAEQIVESSWESNMQCLHVFTFYREIGKAMDTLYINSSRVPQEQINKLLYAPVK